MADTDQTGEKLKVFISYSRANVEWADQILELLEDRGFDAILDRHDIVPGEPWEERLSNLIFECDKVVFILTETSAASEICRWEVTTAAEQGKPMIPVTIGPMGGVDVPKELSSLNYIYFYADPNKPGSGPFAGAKELDTWLRTDLAWTRERTRLIGRARQHSENPVDALLMRGEELAEARDWASRKPDDATVPASITSYIEASDVAEAALKAQADADIAAREEALAKAQEEQLRRRRATRRGLFAAVLIGVVGAATTVFAAGYSLYAEEVMSESLAALATQKANENQHAQGILMSLIADPKSETGLTGISNRVFDMGENYAAQDALMANLVSNPIAGVFDTESYITGIIPNPTRVGVFATVHDDYEVRIWNIGSEQMSAVLPHDTSVMTADWHPDGVHLITGGYDGVARYWDTTSGSEEPIAQFFGHDDWIREVKLFDNGQRFITAADDSLVKVWNLNSQVPEREFELADGEWPYSMDLSADERLLLVGTDYGLAYLWDLEGDGTVRQIFQNGYSSYTAATFDPAGNRVALGMDTGSIDIWWVDAPTAEYQINYHSDVIQNLSFLDDGSTLISASMDGRAAFWNTDFQTAVPERVFNHADQLGGAVLDPTGSALVTATTAGRVTVYDMPSVGTQQSQTGLASLSFDPNGQYFVSVDLDGTAKLYERGNPQPVQTFSAQTQSAQLQKAGGDDANSGVTSAIFHPDGRFVITGHANGRARIWRVGELDLPEEMRLFESSRAVTALAVTEDGTGLLAGTTNGEVHLRRFGAASVEQVFAAPSTDTVSSENTVFSIDASSNGEHVVVGYLDRTVRLWRMGQDSPVSELIAHDDWVRDVKFLPGGNEFISVSDDSLAILWNTIEPYPQQLYLGHFGWIQSLDIHPDGREFVTAADDGTVRLWQLDRSGALQVFDAGGENVVDVEFTPDGREIVAVSTSGKVRVFRRSDLLDHNLDEQINYACITLLELGKPYFTEADIEAIPGIGGRTEAQLDPCDHRGSFE